MLAALYGKKNERGIADEQSTRFLIQSDACVFCSKTKS